VSLAVGIVQLVVGMAFMCWGAYSVLRPRRQSDVDWIESNPLSNWTLGGYPLGFDRMGGVASLLAGSVALILGVAVLLS
jgi:hypothetical protein